MGELLLVITIVTLVVLAIRRGGHVVLDNPVIIHRHGQYHITLAPQLNRAQTFIEQIAMQFMLLHPPQGDLSTQYYEVRDPMVFGRGESAYLLAITLRDGVLYFQAINPQPLIYDADSHYKTLREFSGAVLRQHPLSLPADEQWAEKLRDSIGTIAGQLNINVKEMQAPG